MSPRFLLLTTALLGGFAGTASAATDGQAGTTSTGSFANVFNSQSVRDVRIFGLQDAMVTYANWVAGASDKFCVSSTQAGDVMLTFSSANWGSQGTVAKDIANAELPYSLVVSSTSNPNTTPISVSSNTFRLPSADVLMVASSSDAISCTATNANVTKAVKASSSTLPNTSVYMDTVTVVATPL